MAESPEILVQPAGAMNRPSAWRAFAPAAALVVGMAVTSAASASTVVPAAPAPVAAASAKAAPAKHAVSAARTAPIARAVPAATPVPRVASAAKVATVARVAPAPTAAAVKPAARPAAVTVAAAPLVHPNSRPAPAGPAVRTASLAGSSAPVVTAVPQNGVATAANPPHLDDHLTYQYNALGRRDPFQSLVDGAFVGLDVGGDAPPDPGGIKVVGIVWGANDQFALVEDVRGNSFVLRKGDKLQNGIVEGLKRDGVIVNITAEGQSQSVVIPLVRKGDQNAR